MLVFIDAVDPKNITYNAAEIGGLDRNAITVVFYPMYAECRRNADSGCGNERSDNVGGGNKSRLKQGAKRLQYVVRGASVFYTGLIACGTVGWIAGTICLIVDAATIAMGASEACE